MGLETDIFVAGEKVSQSFICPICQGVVDPAVTTPCEHLFCEECLLRWFERKDRGSESCPSCNQLIDAESVTRPPRIIQNLVCPSYDFGFSVASTLWPSPFH